MECFTSKAAYSVCAYSPAVDETGLGGQLGETARGLCEYLKALGARDWRNLPAWERRTVPREGHM